MATAAINENRFTADGIEYRYLISDKKEDLTPTMWAELGRKPTGLFKCLMCYFDYRGKTYYCNCLIWAEAGNDKLYIENLLKEWAKDYIDQ